MQEANIPYNQYTQNCYWVARFGGRRPKVTEGPSKLEVTVTGSGAWREAVEQYKAHDRL